MMAIIHIMLISTVTAVGGLMRSECNGVLFTGEKTHVIMLMCEEVSEIASALRTNCAEAIKTCLC